MPLAQVSLADKYTLGMGRVFLTAVQALVRLPLEQARRDKAAGHNTGGFISGYRGSPLGGYDEALWRAEKLLNQNNVHFQPGLNEEIAATSVWGAQQVGLFPGATVDGVFGIWYGKGPGVDRSIDALKHANLAGTSPLGGALAFAGDDHGCVSSTLPHQSEYELIGAMLPVLAPATVQDYLEMGLTGFALSRYSGCWVAIKATSETAEASASIAIGPIGRASSSLPISSLRRAGSRSAGPIRRWSRNGGCTGRAWTRSPPSRAPTGSTASNGTIIRRGLASWRRARRGLTSARP